MNWRKAGLTTLVILGILLLTLPALAGCGGGSSTKKVIKIGVLADYTGPASFGMKPTMQAMKEYFVMMKDTDPLPGVEVEWIDFDTALDYTKVVPGYNALKGQGVMALVIPSGSDRTILKSKVVEDKMPVVGTQGQEELLSNQWQYSIWSTIQSQGEAAMQWIMSTWDYAGKGQPKIGHIGWSLAITDYYQQGIDRVLAKYPDKFTWVGVQKGTTTQVTWTSEIEALKNCDFIVVSTVGSQMSTFVDQYRNKGYTASFISGNEAFPGFFDLVVDKTPASKLYGCYYVGWWPWWGEDVPFIEGATDYVEKKHPDQAARLMMGSPVLSGWQMGMFIEDAIRRAVEEVGADNIDSEALQKAFVETNKEVEGFGNTWKITENNTALSWMQRAFEWKAETGKWQSISEWILPLSMPQG